MTSGLSGFQVAAGHHAELCQLERLMEEVAKMRGPVTTVRVAVTVIFMLAECRRASALPRVHTYKGCTKSQQRLSCVGRSGLPICTVIAVRAARVCKVQRAMRLASAVDRVMMIGVIVPASTVWEEQHPASVLLQAHAHKGCMKSQRRRSCQGDARVRSSRHWADGSELFLP